MMAIPEEMRRMASELRATREELASFKDQARELKKELRAEGIYLVKGPKSIKEAGGRGDLNFIGNVEGSDAMLAGVTVCMPAFMLLSFFLTGIGTPSLMKVPDMISYSVPL